MGSVNGAAPKEAAACPQRSLELQPEANGRNPLVSCLCVTRGRVELLKRAVACFLQQTYIPRELVIVYDADDVATRDFAGGLDSPWIRRVEAPATPKLPLGAARNLAIASSRGPFIAQWDDDDWYAPNRLAAQMDALQRGGKPGCVLQRLTLFDMATEKAHVSHRRCWEGSLVARRDSVPSYPELPRAEDTPVVTRMFEQGMLALLDAPELYVYVYHGTNTWDRGHWDHFLLRWSRPLPEMVRRQVMVSLGGNDSAEWARRRIAASAAAVSKRTWIDKARKWITGILPITNQQDPYHEFIARAAERLLATPDNTIGLLAGRKFLDLQPHHFEMVRQGQARFGVPCDQICDDIAASCSRQRRSLARKLYFGAVRGGKYLALLAKVYFTARVIVPRIIRRIEAKSADNTLSEACITSRGRAVDPAGPQASIVIVSFNRLLYLRNTLAAFLETVGQLRYELIVVDNGSQDGSVEFLTDAKRKGLVSKLVFLKENRGHSAGYNLGFAVTDTRSEYLVKLDSDIRILSAGGLAEAIAFLSANRDVGFVALNQVNHVCVRLLPWFRVGGREVMDFAGWTCGSAIVIPRRVWNELGCFVEDAKLIYPPDDIDYYVRASRKGYRVFYLRHVMAHHQDALDRSTYRIYNQSKPRGESAELALRLAQDYDRGVRPLEVHYEKYRNMIMPEDGILVEGAVCSHRRDSSSPAEGEPEQVP